ncbi:Structural maintenance of chromosomes protein 1 [Tieghemiomyces parasiticus]|uniref:Structural maintenance of chromosomes protein n=1 Tax=Tieghemiomyces parasiticus TaxID=78921 RepID=A0A9W8AF29_9FUNG|nr:Structural maintenance of chromosomes protein 1 [Tieghemiomyces parasiticus]
MGRLVELEVENFKSYKGRQKIGPFKSFTSVIGPNGAGKSNLMDAISFVLGVKSAQLRSAQLKELIYSGRARHQPGEGENPGDGDERLPRRGYVAALYITDDGKELRFMRTITSSGSSEYKINGKTVTHTEYNGLLEKQNILIKARNFLVFQGDVEAVASQSARDLTLMIEQISGSWEYRSEYDQLKAQQELATENSNLTQNKKKAIGVEIKGYQEQKAELDRFEQLTSKKNALVVHHLLWRMYHIEHHIAELEKELDANHDQMEAHRERQKAGDDALKEARREHARIYKEISMIEKRIKQHDLELEMEKPFMIGLEEKIAHLVKKTERGASNLNLVQRDEVRQATAVTELQAELATVDASAARFEAQMKEKMKQRGPVLDDHALAEYNRLRETATVQTVQAQHELDTLARGHKAQAEETARLAEKVQTLHNRRANLNDNTRGLTDYLNNMDAQIATLRSELDECNTELQQFQTERQRIHQTEIEANEKLTSVLNKLAQARVDKRESERESRMKECLESLKRIFPGVYGRVSDLCRPSQRKYDAAVAVALGRNIDAVVVDKQSTAIECIQHMKEQRAGQATFLPLDTLHVRPLQEKYRSYIKGARLAVDVLQYDPALEKAVHFVCGNTLVCDSQKVAKEIVYDRRQEVKAVALDGTVFHKTGMITGGTQDQAAASGQQRWEDKELENLQRAKDHLVTQVNDLAREKRKYHSDELIRSRHSGLSTRLQFVTEERSTAARKLEGVTMETENVVNQLSFAEPRLTEMQTQTDAQAAQLATLQTEVDRVQDTVFAAFCRRIGVRDIREYEAQQVKFSQETTELRLKFSNQQSKLRNQLMFEEQQLQGLRDRVQRLERNLAEDRAQLAHHETDRASRQATIARITETTATLRRELASVRARHEAQGQVVSDAKKALAATMREFDQLVKDSAARESNVQKYHVERASILRRCKLEEIPLPLTRGSLANLALEEANLFREPDEMDLDSDDESGGLAGADSLTATQSTMASQVRTPQQRAAARQRASQWSIEVDFAGLSNRERANDADDIGDKFADQVNQISSDLDRLAPNMHAHERLGGVEARLREAEVEVETTRREAKSAKERFQAVKQKRYDLFHRAYHHISDKIDQIYKDLTKSATFPLGGTAYLSLENNEDPYLHGIKYHAMPPMKRFRDMEQLSGGEKTVAALALLFAIHSFHPSPFFVLDEVDAALDNTNVAKVANYIRENCGDNFQFIVISLKQSLYEKAQSLVGIYREQSINSSQTLTIDLEQYPE